MIRLGLSATSVTGMDQMRKFGRTPASVHSYRVGSVCLRRVNGHQLGGGGGHRPVVRCQWLAGGGDLLSMLLLK